MNKLQTLICFIVLGLSVTACGQKPIPVTQEFWDDKGKKVAIVLHDLPEEGDFVPQGGQGLVDILVNEAVAGKLNTHMHSLNAKSFKNVTSLFKSKLKEAGFTPSIYKEHITISDLKKRKNTKSGFFDRNLDDIFKATKADYVILLHLQNFGSTRTYYSVIPLGEPQAFASVRGIMVEKDSYKLAWDTGSMEGRLHEPVTGEWDQSPDFPNITAAVKRALKKAQIHLRDLFFNR